MTDLFTRAARNRVFANLVLVFVLLAGLLATLNMVREMFPVFSLDRMLISVPYPGADPEEVEEGICRKLEDALEGVQGIKEYYTWATEGAGSALVEIDEEAADKQAVKDDIRARIDAISTFPPDAEKPVIRELFFRRDVIQLAVWGDVPEKILKETAADIRDELRALPEISHVTVGAVRRYEISIEVSEERLRELGLSLLDVSRAVRTGSLNLPSGMIRTREGEIKVRTLGRRYTAEDFASLVVAARPDGSRVFLRDIATIRDDFEESANFGLFDGKRAALVTVTAEEGEDAIRIAAAVRRYVARKAQELPEGVHLTAWRDLSRLIQGRIDVLTRNGLMGFGLVLILLWLFLTSRLAFWVGLGVPISLAGGLAATWLVGGSINMLTLFGMIMVVGIAVDDALVVGEAIYVHRRMGKPPLRAAVDGVKEVWWPVTGGVLTTIIAFVPMFFVTGIMGKFMAVLPVVVIATLCASLLESLFVLPAHLNHLPEIRSPDRRGLWGRLIWLKGTASRALEAVIRRFYLPYLRWALRWRYVVAAAGLAVLLTTVGLLRGGFVKLVVFPQIDTDFLTAHVDFPEGAPPAQTWAAVRRMVRAFEQIASRFQTKSGEPLAQHIWASVGERRGLVAESGENIGEVTVELLPSERRGVHSEAIKQAWRQAIGSMPEARKIEFLSSMGGPRGNPIEIRLLGHDQRVLARAAEDLKSKLATYKGVFNIADDRELGRTELRLALKPVARTLGLTLQDLALQVRAMWYGDEALRIQRGRDDIRVKVRYPAAERHTLATLDRARIRLPGGGEVPLGEVATIHLTEGYATIYRQSGFRRVVVTADVDEAVANAQEILAELRRNFLPRLTEDYPGLVYKLEGQERDRRESVSSLLRGLLLAVVAIFVLLATVLRSYVQPGLIVFVIPMGFVGAVLGHLITGLTISLLSLFGLVALAGVAVNDAIILMDYFNQRLRVGDRFHEALLATGERRFRAMFLTTFTTVAGLLPLMLERSFQAQYLIPMAMSIAFGLMAASLATLMAVPPLLVVVNDLRRVGRWLWRGEWPEPEAVEPAAAPVRGRRRRRPEPVVPSAVPAEPVEELR